MYGFKIIKKENVQIRQNAHLQKEFIDLNIIKIEDVHLIVMIHMLTRRMNKDI